MSRIGDNIIKPLAIHRRAREMLHGWSKPVRRELGEALRRIQYGANVTFPLSRPMPSVFRGVSELRVADAAGIYRIFYFVKSKKGIIVFHAFMKKTEKTPSYEIRLGRRRLREMLIDE